MDTALGGSAAIGAALGVAFGLEREVRLLLEDAFVFGVALDTVLDVAVAEAALELKARRREVEDDCTCCSATVVTNEGAIEAAEVLDLER